MATPIDTLLDQILYNSVTAPENKRDDGVPFVTHTGEFELGGGVVLLVHVLSNGQRVIDERSLTHTKIECPVCREMFWCSMEAIEFSKLSNVGICCDECGDKLGI